MANDKQKIHLTAEQETLLITLYSKASACPDGLLDDKKSQEILAQIDYDFSQLKVPTGTSLTVCIRARKIDENVQAHLASHPDSGVIYLGCGLDSRCARINRKNSEWYDLDFPDVIELRRNFFQESSDYHMIPCSVTDLAWTESIPDRSSIGMIIAEGLMMYLTEAQVKAIILKLKECFPGSLLVFDAYSKMTASRVKDHPSLRKTGAKIQWGIDDPESIENWGEGIQLQEEWFFTQSKAIAQLAFRYQLIFKITGLFMTAKRAHRILIFKL